MKCFAKSYNSNYIPSFALIDSGASAHGFVDTKFAHENNLELLELPCSRSLKVFDGTESVSGKIIHVTKTLLDINGHSETILLFFTTLAYFNIVLGLPWLQYHNSKVIWANKTLEFSDEKCQNHINEYPTLVHAIDRKDDQTLRKAAHRNVQDIVVENCDFESFQELSDRDKIDVMAISIENIHEALKKKPRINLAENFPRFTTIFYQYFQRKKLISCQHIGPVIIELF